MQKRLSISLAFLLTLSTLACAQIIQSPSGAGMGPGFGAMQRKSVIQVTPDTRFASESLVIDARLWELIDPGVGQGPATLKEHGLSTSDYTQTTDSQKPVLETLPTIGVCAKFTKVSDSEGDWLEAADNNFNDVTGSYTVSFYGVWADDWYGWVVSNSDNRVAATVAGYDVGLLPDPVVPGGN